MGILAMVGMQGVAVKHSTDAKNRGEASYFADQIISQMWANRTSLASFANYPSAGGTPCTPGGSASSNANVINWLAAISAALPDAVATKQQIVVNTTGAVSLVTVTVCWKAPQETAYHNFVATAQINGN